MKIELTAQEIEILEGYERGDFENPADDTREMIGKLAVKALAYERETRSEDDPDDLLLWYYDKYKAQQAK